MQSLKIYRVQVGIDEFDREILLKEEITGYIDSYDSRYIWLDSYPDPEYKTDDFLVPRKNRFRIHSKNEESKEIKIYLF